MASPQRLQEMEFELALTGVLEDIYDLPVRSEADPLDRRSDGCAILCFDYQRDADANEVKIVVAIDGSGDASYTMRADFTNSATILESAEICEELAFAIGAWLEASAAAGARPARRWDD